MPSYDFCCDACDTCFERQLRIDDRRIPTTEPCPACGAKETVTLMPAAPGFADGYRIGRRNLPDTWKDTLKRIKSHHRHSTVNTD